MKKLLTGLVIAGLLTACGGTGTDAVAATVDGTEFTVADVRTLPFESGASLDSQLFASYLGALIQWEILERAAAEEYDVAPTAEEIEAELQNVLATQAAGMTLTEVAEQENFSEDTIRRIVGIGLIRQQVAEKLAAAAGEPTAEEVATAMDEAVVGLTEVCVRHVLVATADEAATAKSRLDDGEEFATVAGELSTDPSAAENGGDLGCAAAQQYVPAFRDAAATAGIDEITEPVESEFGFHVLQVYERTEPTEEELPTEEEVRQSLIDESGTTQLQEWLLATLEGSDVNVAEEFGTWTLDPQPSVVPPST
ncbi:MAG TPA: peptidylprolyl isomerase [Acidimicrobiia bacterium]|nr:peptidylprolyl isomerase [Acidimicrobiia bacterium]